MDAHDNGLGARKKFFGGKTMILTGDATQLGPVKDPALYSKNYQGKYPQKVKNGVGAEVAYVPVGSYSAVGVDGVAYVIANDKSITKDMICQGEAAETTFCK